MDPPSLAAIICPSPIVRCYIDTLFQALPITLTGVRHHASGPIVESFLPFDVCNAFNLRTLSWLLDLEFIQQEDLVLEDRVGVNQYRLSSNCIRTWVIISGPFDPTRENKRYYRLAYNRFWEIKRRSSVGNAPNSIMIHVNTGKRVNLSKRMNVSDWRNPTIDKLRLVRINPQVKSMKSPRTFRGTSREEAWHEIATRALGVREQVTRGRSRYGKDFFQWKRKWAPGGSPLRRLLLGGGAEEGGQSECGPVRRTRESNRWHPYAARCAMPAS